MSLLHLKNYVSAIINLGGAVSKSPFLISYIERPRRRNIPISFLPPSAPLFHSSIQQTTMAVANLQRLSSQVHRLPSLSFFSKSLISRSTATTTTAITSSSTKKVSDRIVRFSAIDFEGKKHEVVGLAGHTLLKALINTGLIDPDSHRLEEIDACSAHCEVNIAQEWLDKLPPRSYDEEYVLVRNSRARILNKHSRLGCQVLLDHDLQGMVVALAEPRPWDTS